MGEKSGFIGRCFYSLDDLGIHWTIDFINIVQ